MGVEESAVLVCPSCGTPTEGQAHCPGCGRSLALRRLVPKTDWDARQARKEERQQQRDAKAAAYQRQQEAKLQPSHEQVAALVELGKSQRVRLKNFSLWARQVLAETEGEEPRLVARHRSGLLLATDERLIMRRPGMFLGDWSKRWSEIASIYTQGLFSIVIQVVVHPGHGRGIGLRAKPRRQAQAIAEFGKQRIAELAYLSAVGDQS